MKRFSLKQERKDYRAALICSVLANIYRDEKKKLYPFTPADFMSRKRGE
ncbi:MAG: phage tail assembly protein T [Eubacteriales bacterium]